MSPEPSTSLTPRGGSRHRLVVSAVAAGILVAVGVFGFQELRLSRNLRLARDHVPLIRAKLERDNRFLGVAITESTTLHGSIRVGGFVIDDAAAVDLRNVIGSTSPPVAIDWQVRVLGAAALGQALSKAKPATAPAATSPTGN